jgi:hypothetical protein
MSIVHCSVAGYSKLGTEKERCSSDIVQVMMVAGKEGPTTEVGLRSQLILCYFMWL